VKRGIQNERFGSTSRAIWNSRKMNFGKMNFSHAPHTHAHLMDQKIISLKFKASLTTLANRTVKVKAPVHLKKVVMIPLMRVPARVKAKMRKCPMIKLFFRESSFSSSLQTSQNLTSMSSYLNCLLRATFLY